ncbi:MAG TPA: extracellular solute-binding protein [Thermomicrobiales bacterium]|nr:extracellular solute-binding protein [Thermomicrobiales bacterium]
MNHQMTRRSLLKGAAAAGAAVAVSRGWAGALAQSTLSGSITVSYPDQAGFKPKYVTQAANDVQTANTGTTVNVDLQQIGDDDFYTKLLLALDSNNGPDVFHFGGNSAGELSDAGYIEPLDDYLATWPDWAQYYPASVQSSVQYKGKTWCVPYGLDTRFLYYRKDVFTKAGLPADWQPANVNAILDAADQIKQGDPDVLPYALYGGQAGSSGTADHAFVPLVWAFGGEVINQDGKWVGDSPAIRKALDYYVRAFQTDKVVDQEILTTTKPWTSMREKLGNGGLGILFEGGWVYGGWATNDKAGTEQNVGYLLFPTETAGPSFTIGGPGTCWYINAASKNKDLAFAFIKAFNTRDIVAGLNAEDPHPVARTDAAETPAFQSNQFLLDSTKSLESAKFIPPDPNYGKVIAAIQTVTGLVADGELSAEDGAKRYVEELKTAVGDDLVVTES